MSPEQCWRSQQPCFPSQFSVNHNIMKMHSKKLRLGERLSHFKLFIVNVHFVWKHIQQPSRIFFLFNLQNNKENKSGRNNDHSLTRSGVLAKYTRPYFIP